MPYLSFESDFARRVLDGASSMMAYWDKDLRCRYANSAYRTWFGKSGEELLGTTLDALLGPEIFKLNEPFIRKALAGQPQVFERLIPGPDGIQRPSLARYHPDIVDGAVVGFIAEVSDVGVLKTLEASLQAQIALKQHALVLLDKKDSALETAQILGRMGSWEWEIDSDISTWSSGLYRLFGLDANRLPPTYAEHAKLYTPASWVRLQEAVAAALSEGRPYVLELEYRRADGSTGWLEARGDAERASDGAITKLHGTAHDITDIHALLSALQHQTSRLEHALDTARLGTWRWDADADSLHWEDCRVREILDVDQDTPDCVAGQAFFAQRLRADRPSGFFGMLAQFLAAGATQFMFSDRLTHADGRERWVECGGRETRASDGSRVIIGTVQDVTEHVAAKERLQQLLAELRQNDERKSTFLFALGHELRNGIAPLWTGLQMLTKRFSGMGLEKVEGIMSRQLTHLTRLVEDIYDLRRIQRGDLELRCARLCLKETVEAAVDMCSQQIAQMQHQFHLQLPENHVIVYGDGVRLVQVVVNLIVNAAKFTPPHGNIRVSLEVNDETSEAMVVVSDNGHGMESDVLDTIFDLYAQVGDASSGQQPGLGIGLFLVKQLVERQGGKVTAASEGLGKGSTFTVRMPLA